MKQAKRIALYALSALAVVIALNLFHPSGTAVGVYWSVSFWLLAGADFYRSQVLEGGKSEVQPRSGYSFADRFLGYLFAAPFIFPAKALTFARDIGKSQFA